jgi:hypothetical protein
VEAAHIIPQAIMKPRKNASAAAFAKDILASARLLEVDMFTCRNGMLLCPLHHTTFDKYMWTVNETDMRVVVRDSAAGHNDLQAMAGLELSFSHRADTQVPPVCVWAAYNSLIYVDSGRNLRGPTKTAGTKKSLSMMDPILEEPVSS